MDKAVLRNFAIESRKDLMEKIDRKIKLFYIDEEFKKDNRGDVIVLSNDKHTLTLTKEDDLNRDKLIKRIVEYGYEQVVEEAAYTWFNRIIAIRYMEIHDYLPLTKDNQSLGIRVLSSNENTPNPEILKFSNLSNSELSIGFDKNIYNSKNTEDEKFKYILLIVCKKIANVIPQIFGGITDYIDLLIPDNMLSSNGFVGKLINEVSQNNFDKVEILGWLYQYYNQVEKDRVISAKKTYKKREIAYATQLFTPDWIVKYMVDNSLGKYWIDSSKNNEIEESLDYYVNLSNNNLKQINPEDIKFIDPCCGSGHILVYAFEVLFNIYKSCGYNSKKIPSLILKNNLYGLDIDDRAGQLSILSVLLKAREYDKNIFNNSITKKLNIVSIRDSQNIDQFALDSLPEKLKVKANKLKDIYYNAKEIGSLTIAESDDFDDLYDYINNTNILETIIIRDVINDLIKQNNILYNKYDIVVTNPPYLNNSLMSDNIKNYLSVHYKGAKYDLFSAFIIRNVNFGKENAFFGFMTPFVWMFISSYESLRKFIVDNLNISTLIQLEYSALEEATVPICTFVLNNSSNKQNGIYFRLTDFPGGMEVQKNKFLEINNNHISEYIYENSIDKFKKIEGYPIAYWVSEHISEIFKNEKKLSEYADLKQGMITGDNNRFLRLWWEVDNNKINKKWFHHNKGGEFRKWYGNQEYLINYENDAYEIKNYKVNGKLASRPQNLEYNFKKSISWSLITSGDFSARYYDESFTFNVAGLGCFPKKEENINYILGLLNTKLVKNITKILNPTLNMNVGDVAKIPIIYNEGLKKEIDPLVDSCISISKDEWDSYEKSWDFAIDPICDKGNGLISDKIEEYLNELSNKMEKMILNETLINEKFICLYGLQSELDSKIESKDISINIPERKTLIKNLISYIVGCMFGRYSINQKGLVYAGGKFEQNAYKSYSPDEDNIIPISDNENVYYNDDIVGKFKTIIEKIFGIENINENLDYIAETLGKRGTESSVDTIRRYFVNDFYNDHVKMYQKRPIYWLFDSGKKNGFKCLVYLHRYDEQIVSRIRTKYLHNTLSIYQRTVEEIDYKLNNEELSTTDKRELQNKKSDLNSKITECNEYEEMVGNVANKMIKLDLDDGVVNNYAKFVDDNGKSILAKIK